MINTASNKSTIAKKEKNQLTPSDAAANMYIIRYAVWQLVK